MSTARRRRASPEELIKVEDHYYIRATSALADERRLVLKQGESFAVFDRHGDVQPVGSGEQGVFHEGTRFLSLLRLTLDGQRPLLLSSGVRRDNSVATVDMTNPDLIRNDEVVVPRGALHISRSKLLWDGSCHERIEITNYGSVAVEAVLDIEAEADFADVFEVRGTKRPRRGEPAPAKARPSELRFGYRGLDGIERTSVLRARPAADEASSSHLAYVVRLAPAEQVSLELVLECEIGKARVAPTFRAALQGARDALDRHVATSCRVTTSNQRFDDWLDRSLADLSMLISDTPQGPYPYAGVPWFSTPFGRDGIITALECLWIDPALARGVLRFLAASQATERDPAHDAEPGKILHEARGGEMAALGEIPFGRYFGSVDATPLFVVLAGEYVHLTGDRAIAAELWPAIEAALAWIERDGDLDGDGLVEYARRSGTGLLHQGWKDSSDPVFHADGTLAEPPIALCEVQGYVWAALGHAATLARLLGRAERAGELEAKAERLRHRFEASFWDEELGTYVLALDRDKRPCRVVSSNAGHVLLSGIASPERAARTARTLLTDASFSGFGIRTIAAGAARYNPMSYHNGSIWPHDNALIAAGFARYRLREAALEVLRGIFEASLYMPLRRLPELYCGFGRRPGEGPILYPVACSPQAWAAGAPFLLLQACLGVVIDGAAQRVSFHHPALPPFLDEVRLSRLWVGEGEVDVMVHRHNGDVGISILRREGPVELVVVR